MPNERWQDKLDNLCDKCKYDYDTWCKGRSCGECELNPDGGTCVCLSVHTANCSHFIPKE